MVLTWWGRRTAQIVRRYLLLLTGIDGSSRKFSKPLASKRSMPTEMPQGLLLRADEVIE